MAGIKRSYDGTDDMEDPKSESPYLSMFETFRTKLDAHHDRRERIIKASRDITALSKKIIFSLQRAQNINARLPANLAKDAGTKKQAIHDLFKSIEPDLQGINAWRYQRSICFGYQEYIEAASFQQYLENGTLLSMQDLAASLPEEIPPASEEDHILGLFDLTGEMMRFAITYTATHGKVPSCIHSEDVDMERQSEDLSQRTCLTDLQQLRGSFEILDTKGNKQIEKEYDQKMKVMKTSVEKVENVAYGLAVRKGERPAGWVPDMSTDRRTEVEAVG
ncbi:MAG: hypothetical protein Q9227_007230 [Pyrenula ochraceoflavens]